jgi:hypothetical protein
MTSGHDSAEDRYTRAMLDVIGDRLDASRTSAAAEVDAYLANLREGVAQQVAESAARIQQTRAEQAAWMASLYSDEPDEGTPTDVAHAQTGASAPGLPASPRGSGHGQLTHADELAEAARIRSLSLREYAQERERLIRPGQPVMF